MHHYQFNGRQLIIATMHGKEKVIAPILQAALGVEIATVGLDTDQFGTFSGEVERIVDPVEAARRKCLAACKEYGGTLAIASEGSFGPHPTMFFAHADDEILVLVDLENNLEIKSRELTTDTNFNGAKLTTWSEIVSFAKTALFPQHGLIVRNKKEELGGLVKGIHDWKVLKDAAEACLVEYGEAFIETDMRAMHNPTRMKVIEKATKKLAETILRTCPKCFAPGFDVIKALPGLPCEQCGAPTRSTIAYVYECQKCEFREQKKFPNGKITESPMYCTWCNP